MTTGAFLLLAMALAAAVVDWIAVHHSNKALEYVAKPLTMVLLIGATLALDPTDSAVRAWFIAALVLSLAGDVFLMLPKDLFVFGLGSFLLGHIAYAGGWTSDEISGARFLLGLWLVVLTLVAIRFRILRGVRV